MDPDGHGAKSKVRPACVRNKGQVAKGRRNRPAVVGRRVKLYFRILTERNGTKD